MATNQVNAKTEKRLLEYHYDYLTNIDKGLYLSAKEGDSIDSLCAPTMMEHAIAYNSNGKLKCVSINHQDFSDDSDLKTSTTAIWKDKQQEYHHEVVIQVKGKKGSIRIITYDIITDMFYYFFIPKKAYKNNKTIHIAFSILGGLKINKHNGKILKYWEYECKDFLDLANK